MTVESKKLLQHDAPIIREASPIEDAPKEASNPNPKSSEKAGHVIEIGGRGGPEPTRYGDWEKGGRCIDF